MNSRTIRLTETAVLVAIILIMAFTQIGYVRIGPLSISLITIPVAVGAVMLGPGTGALLGAIFGITSFIQCFAGDAFGAALLSINPFFTFLVCVPTRTLAGFLSGAVFGAVRKKFRVPAYYIGSFAMAFLNTVFFMTVLVLCFWNAPAVQTWSQSLNAFNPLIFILASVSVNAAVEWISTAAVGGSVGLALSKTFGGRGKNR
jgi:uncharacterized membrane protein